MIVEARLLELLFLFFDHAKPLFGRTAENRFRCIGVSLIIERLDKEVIMTTVVSISESLQLDRQMKCRVKESTHANCTFVQWNFLQYISKYNPMLSAAC